MQLSSFTATVIIHNPTVGLGWNFTWSLLTCFHVNQSLGRHHNMGQHRLYKFCYLLPSNLWTFYLAWVLFLQEYDSFFRESPSSARIFNGLQYSFQVWKGFIKVSESFSYKDFLFILTTTRKEDFRINCTIRSDFLVYLGLLNSDKSDSSIFRIVIFGFLLFSS